MVVHDPDGIGAGPRRSDADQLEAAIGALAHLDEAGLRRRWRGVIGRAMPDGLGRALALRILAYHLQAQQYGDLDRASVQALASIVGSQERPPGAESHGPGAGVGSSKRRIAKVVKACHDLPGQDLFQYVDEAGMRHHVTSSDVNNYLRETSGLDITAKHFRTWAGTVLAAMALSEFEAVDSTAASKRNIKAAIESVATRLGNTPTICRKCYIHPEVLTAYLDGNQLAGLKQEVEAELRDPADLKPEEAALLGLLSRRLSRDLNHDRKAA